MVYDRRRSRPYSAGRSRSAAEEGAWSDARGLVRADGTASQSCRRHRAWRTQHHDQNRIGVGASAGSTASGIVGWISIADRWGKTRLIPQSIGRGINVSFVPGYTSSEVLTQRPFSDIRLMRTSSSVDIGIFYPVNSIRCCPRYNSKTPQEALSMPIDCYKLIIGFPPPTSDPISTQGLARSPLTTPSVPVGLVLPQVHGCPLSALHSAPAGMAQKVSRPFKNESNL